MTYIESKRWIKELNSFNQNAWVYSRFMTSICRSVINENFPTVTEQKSPAISIVMLGIWWRCPVIYFVLCAALAHNKKQRYLKPQCTLKCYLRVCLFCTLKVNVEPRMYVAEFRYQHPHAGHVERQNLPHRHPKLPERHIITCSHQRVSHAGHLTAFITHKTCKECDICLALLLYIK